MKKTKKQLKKEPEVKKQSSFELSLTRYELLHLRDLMGILLPPDGAQTISQALASTEDRTLIESMLWGKVSSLCELAKLPLNSEAPDYIVAPISPPPMGIFQINQDLQTSKSEPAGFVLNDEENNRLEEEETE